jgi:anti-anti-sigma regulatory factor
MTAASPLEISTTDTGLALAGEIDAFTAPALAEAIEQCDQSHIMIDMAEVEFLTQVLRVPARTQYRCHQRGATGIRRRQPRRIACLPGSLIAPVAMP